LSLSIQLIALLLQLKHLQGRSHIILQHYMQLYYDDMISSFAKDIIKFVAEKNIIRPNLPKTALRYKYFSQYPIPTHIKKFAQIRRQYLGDTLIEKIFNSFFLIIKHNQGNCRELTYLALAYLVKEISVYSYDIRWEVLTGVNFDHSFIVLNRPESSNLAYWPSWGKNVMVVDPWINCAFPACHIPLYWGFVATFHRWDKQANNKSKRRDIQTTIKQLKCKNMYNSTRNPSHNLYAQLKQISLVQSILELGWEKAKLE
jgi:hypothetical protein